MDEQENSQESPAAGKPKPRRRPKPDIEGINAPSTKKTIYVKPTMTDQELLPEEPDNARIVSPSIAKRASQKSHGFRNFVLGFIIFAIVAYGGYIGYAWHKGRLSNRQAIGVQEKTPAPQPAPADTAPTTSTSSAAALVPAATTTPATSTAPIAAAPAPSDARKLTIAKTPTGYLRVRSGATSSASEIAQVHPGEMYSYVASKNGWYQIVLANGATGWVSGQYVAVNK